jgi:hypothetical protein
MYTLVYSEKKPTGFSVADNQETNIIGTHECEKLDEALRDRDSLNQQLFKRFISVEKCLGCGKFFILPARETRWFKKQGVPAPKRCRLCRAARKAAGTNPTFTKKEA